MSSTTNNNIGIQFIGKQWEQIRSVPVDREGEFAFTLRPRTDKFAHRVVCEVSVQDNVKIITIRSTYRVENYTLYPLEITLVDDMGRPVHSLEKIGALSSLLIPAYLFNQVSAPGQDYALPIEGVGQTRIKIQPDRKPPVSKLCFSLNIFLRGFRLQMVSGSSMGGSHLEKEFHYSLSTHRPQ